jgi:hypothetical protein
LVSIPDFALRRKKYFGIYGLADGIFPIGAGSGSVLVTVAPLSLAAKKALIASATWLDALSRHCAEVSASPSFAGAGVPKGRMERRAPRTRTRPNAVDFVKLSRDSPAVNKVREKWL